MEATKGFVVPAGGGKYLDMRLVIKLTLVEGTSRVCRDSRGAY
jgi:hypothetical protein